MTPSPTSAANQAVQRVPLARRYARRAVDTPADRTAYTQGALALSYPLIADLEADPRSTALVVVPHGSRPDPGSGAEAWSATFVQAVVEVIACDRPLTQLVRWTSRTVYADIARRRELVARHRLGLVRASRQQVATVRVCRPTSAALEIAARVTFGGRSRAVAVRLDYVKERWLCTAIRFG
jgi:hypothetical protein